MFADGPAVEMAALSSAYSAPEICAVWLESPVSMATDDGVRAMFSAAIVAFREFVLDAGYALRNPLKRSNDASGGPVFILA